MEKLNIIEKIKLVLAYRYAKHKKFNEELKKIKYGNNDKKKLSFGKCLTIFMLVNFTIVEVYSMWAMFVLSDLSALPTLITSVIGQAITLISYNFKSMIENKTGGLIYEAAMHQIKTDVVVDNDAEG